MISSLRKPTIRTQKRCEILVANRDKAAARLRQKIVADHICNPDEARRGSARPGASWSALRPEVSAHRPTARHRCRIGMRMVVQATDGAKPTSQGYHPRLRSLPDRCFDCWHSGIQTIASTRFLRDCQNWASVGTKMRGDVSQCLATYLAE